MKTMQRRVWCACLAGALTLAGIHAEETAVVKQNRVNVRGQASLFGEVITQLKQGEKVSILEEITLEKPKEGEPAKWAKIKMPAHTPVWVFTSYLDAATKTVQPARLNLRAGPGENYSIVGRLEKGAAIKEIRTVDDWTEIETPDAAYAFVSMNFLEKQVAAAKPVEKKDAAPAPAHPAEKPAEKRAPPAEPAPASEPKAAAPVAEPVKTEPAPAPVEKPPAPPPTETPAKADPAPAPVASSPATLVAPPPAAPGRRIVRREGIVRSTTSIQAPTYFELISPETRKTINYLHSTQPDLKLKDYRGKRIVVSGEEGIDARWPGTPLIEVDTLDLAP